jgi:alpha-beta hydrolase superfamily lysophospholipase
VSVVRAWIGGLAAALVLSAGDATGAALSRADVSIPMDDGVAIASTLYLPSGAAPPGGWPAVVLVHGFGGNREQVNAFVTAYGFVERDYAVLTVDARGHGGSGGLFGFGGSRDVADLRAVHSWLAARADVSDSRIAAWGISYGGGAVMNSLVGGVPWRAVVTFESWTDLLTALMPQGLAKSGVISSLAASIPAERRDPSLAPVFTAALLGQTAVVKPWAAERSSLSKLAAVTTPVFIAQGRRDFLFGLEQATTAFRRLAGPKTLYLGLHGHAPSTFPAADTTLLLTNVKDWLDCHLRSLECESIPDGVYLMPERISAALVFRPTLPQTKATQFGFPGVTTFAARGKAVRRSAPLRNAIEAYGSPIVKVSIAASGGWSRLVAVLTAKPPGRKEFVVSAGGVPTRNGLRKLTVKLEGQATFIPKGSRLSLTLGSSSLAHSTESPIYLDSPMPKKARLRVGNAALLLPGLRFPVTQ